MKVFKGISEVKESFPKVVLTIGNFDGLHLGHRQIIEAVIERARKIGGTSVVYTFRPHPQEVLSPSSNIQLVNSYEEKLILLERMGVDVVIEEPFSREFSTTEPERFFRDALVKKLSSNAVFVGYDFGFGRDRSGSLDILQKLCAAKGVECLVFKPEKVNGVTCSSSKIREYICAGNVVEANKLLGREFFYRGVVVKGNARGRTIGFRTANVLVSNKVQVQVGVYATRVFFEGQVYDSITNVGRQPTFNSDKAAPVVMETHIFNFDRDIYGETLEVRMIARIRDEKKFAGVDELVDQIKKDIQSAKKLLSN